MRSGRRDVRRTARGNGLSGATPRATAAPLQRPSPGVRARYPREAGAARGDPRAAAQPRVTGERLPVPSPVRPSHGAVRVGGARGARVRSRPSGGLSRGDAGWPAAGTRGAAAPGVGGAGRLGGRVRCRGVRGHWTSSQPTSSPERLPREAIRDRAARPAGPLPPPAILLCVAAARAARPGAGRRWGRPHPRQGRDRGPRGRVGIRQDDHRAGPRAAGTHHRWPGAARGHGCHPHRRQPAA